MPTRGIKRKYSKWEESVLDGHLSFQTDHYIFLRQSLLNISLEKFNKGRMMTEPSLRRYVLIANTLRVIQEEICHDTQCLIPPIDAELTGACDPSSGKVVDPFPQDLENILLPSVEDDCTVTAAIASILKELESVLDESCPQNVQSPSAMYDPEAKLEVLNHPGSSIPSHPQPPCATMKEERFNSNSGSLGDNQEIELIRQLVLAAACSENLPLLPVAMGTPLLEPMPAEAFLPSNVPLEADSSSLVEMTQEAPLEQCVSAAPTEKPKSSEAVFGCFEIMNSGYLNDVSFDDPFSDIDTSVFEREPPFLGAAQYSRLSSEESWFSSSCGSPNFSSSQGIRDPNDLDNIMEILVGS